MLQLKTDLLGSIFGQERAAALLEQVASSVRDRDLLHNSLLQRKSKLQVSISRFTLELGPSWYSDFSSTPAQWLWMYASVSHDLRFCVYGQGRTLM